MTEEPKLPHRLKWGNRTAAKADEAGCLTGIGSAGCTGIKDVPAAGVHGSAADGAGTWSLPPGDLRSVSSGDAFMKKPRAGAYYRYTRPKDTVHEES